MELKVKSVRSELKENILANKLAPVFEWCSQNWRILVGVGVVVLMAFLLSSVQFLRKQSMKEQNWVRLAQAEAFFNQKSMDNAAQILTDIKNSNPKTQEAMFASYYLGQVSLAKKQYDAAAEMFADVAAKSGKSPLKPLALTSLAFSLEEKGDYQAAVETHRQFMSSFAEHFLAAHNQLSLGRVLLKAGEAEAAKETLGQLIDLYPTSPWAENARQIMDKLTPR